MIPRFLLPHYGRIWQRPTQKLIQRRLASTKSTAEANSTPSGQRVLAKPERFNPPSHGSRLPNKKNVPRHYGGDLSFQEKQAQAQKEYPGLMPGEGTFGWWFWNNKWFHMCLTLVCTYPSHLAQPQPFLSLSRWPSSPSSQNQNLYWKTKRGPSSP